MLLVQMLPQIHDVIGVGDIFLAVLATYSLLVHLLRMQLDRFMQKQKKIFIWMLIILSSLHRLDPFGECNNSPTHPVAPIARAVHLYSEIMRPEHQKQITTCITE